MNSPSLSAEDLRSCAFVSLICPLRSRRQRLRKLRPTRLSLRVKSADWRGRSLPLPPIFGCLLPRFPAIGNTCFSQAGHSARLPSNRQLSFSSLARENLSDIKVPGQM